MAKQIEGVYENILRCAKEEFLTKGFNDASLRIIAKSANTSTGSIYTRFKDKNGLFLALVKPLIDMIREMSLELDSTFNRQDAKTQSETMADFCMTSHADIIDFLYANKDAVILLFNCSHGSSCENFLDELIAIEEKSTTNYLKTIGHGNLLEDEVASKFIHNLCVTYCNGIFEPLLQNLTCEQAHAYDLMSTKYHTTGFNNLFKLKS